MAEDSENSENKPIYPVTIHETSPSIPIKLDGTNYRVWSKVLEIFIAGKEMKGYITGRKLAPAENDPSFDKWEAEDARVKSWILNGMPNNLMSNFVQCGDSQRGLGCC